VAVKLGEGNCSAVGHQKLGGVGGVIFRKGERWTFGHIMILHIVVGAF